MRESCAPSPWKSLGCFGVRFFGALIVALILWGGWYAYAAHRLNAKLAEYRARGEPASPQDFVGRPSLPSENAYAITFEAGASLKLSSDEADLVNVTTTLPLSPAQMETARKMLNDHAATLDLLHKARLAPYCVSPFDPINVSRNWENPSVFQTVANYLRIAAFYHHQDGRDDLALDDIHDIHTVAMATSAGHFLIHHLIAGSFEALASQTLLQITPDLSVQNPATPHGAPRDQVLQMARACLDEEPFQESLRASLRSERINDLIVIDSVLSGAHRWLVPLFRLAALREMEDTDALIKALGPDVPPYPRARSHFPPVPALDSNLQGAAHFFSVDYPGIYRAVVLHYRAMTNRKAAGLRLCIRLYELDHMGKIPARFADLVPIYIAALPEDMFRSTGAPFIYDPRRRIFYSVGENDSDDGGSPDSPPFPNWNGKDTVYSLDRPPPPPPPSTEEHPEPMDIPDPPSN